MQRGGKLVTKSISQLVDRMYEVNNEQISQCCSLGGTLTPYCILFNWVTNLEWPLSPSLSLSLSLSLSFCLSVCLSLNGICFWLETNTYTFHNNLETISFHRGMVGCLSRHIYEGALHINTLNTRMNE